LISVYSGGRNVTSEDLSMIRDILSVGGISEMVPEFLINAVGAVAGSGPAFVSTAGSKDCCEERVTVTRL
jgi:pyrroline-5-carboxylate reductase